MLSECMKRYGQYKYHQPVRQWIFIIIILHCICFITCSRGQQQQQHDINDISNSITASTTLTELLINTDFNTTTTTTSTTTGSTSSKIGRIFGGTKVAKGKYPFFVYFTNCCGGTLIRSNLVVTAAHCVNCFIERNSIAIVGSNTRSSSNRYSIQTIIQHPDYLENTFENDIAIVQLDTSSSSSSSSIVNQLIKLNFNKALPSPNTNGTIIGLGQTESIIQPVVLREAIVPFVSNIECTLSYSNHLLQFRSLEMLCAGVSGIDTCQGDSGGPIFISRTNTKTNTTRYIQIGITSWGKGCALPNYPGVYTRISSYRKFIMATVKKYS